MAGIALFATVALSFCGCTTPSEFIHNGFQVGPAYHKPPAPVAANWIDASDKRLRSGEDDLSEWWKVFHDPVLDKLICDAYHQNLTLRQAGFRVLEARAQLAITVGTIFPQTQNLTGSFERDAISRETANRNGTTAKRFISQWNYGFNLAWELDFWGRFRRAIESGSASLDASVEGYDDALVTLLSDVATAYVNRRTLEKRITYARKNADIQRVTYEIAKSKQGIFATGLDVDQALSTLRQTEAGIPELEIAMRQTDNQLCILLGIPTEELQTRLGSGDIPTVPPSVVVGIPADLLRRRPDVRQAERVAAAQCALIGVAESALYPHISIVGTIGGQSELFKHLFVPTAQSASIAPGFDWDLLNYGRLINNVRLQEARFQELVAAYQQTVLNAQLETENGLVSFLRAQARVRLQKESVDAGAGAVKAIQDLWKNGLLTDYTRVAQLEQNQVTLEDTLAQAEGEIALGLIQVYLGLGGGWQIRLNGCSYMAPTPPSVPTTIKKSESAQTAATPPNVPTTIKKSESAQTAPRSFPPAFRDAPGAETKAAPKSAQHSDRSTDLIIFDVLPNTVSHGDVGQK